VPGQPAVSAPEPFAAPIVATPESPAAPVQSQAVVPPPPQTPAPPPSQVPAQTLAQTLAQTPPPVAAPAQSQTTPIQVPAQSQMTPPQVPVQVPPQVAAQTQSQSQASARTGERRESATIERRQTADRREPVTERRDTAVPEHREAAAAERREAARVPPPVTRSPRPESEDAQSVLARLRQIAPGAAPVQDLPQQAERPVRGPSPWLKRLIAARAALAAGQIEDGRRLLQEVQLQLVFRPVNAAEDSAAAGRAARDVAHALEALAGNDLVQSRNYIDRAVGDGTGGAGEAPGREAASPHAGYAPAYPPY